MLGGLRGSLQFRMVILAGTGLLIAFTAFGGLSYWSVDEGIRRTVDERQLLAQTIGHRFGDLIQQNLDTLQEVPFPALLDIPVDQDAVRRTIHEVYVNSIFRGGVYIVGQHGELLMGEPRDLTPSQSGRDVALRSALDTGKPTVSNVYVASTGLQVVTALLPVRDGFGTLAGAVGGDLEVRDRRVQDMLRGVTIGKTGYVQVVDSLGNVVAGHGFGAPRDEHEAAAFTRLARERSAGVSTCHECHVTGDTIQREPQIVDYAPIDGTPWVVLVRQSEAEVFGPLHRLQLTWLLVGVPLFLLLVAFAWGTARSVVRPLAVLAMFAERIAGGDLSTPLPKLGEDEVGRLARTLEAMRYRLGQSVERIRLSNATLEQRVRERTRQLEEQEHIRRELLRKVISAQEEERRRIARELHDETSQSLAALILAVDTAALALGQMPPEQAQRDTPAKLGRLKALAAKVLDGIHALIFDLRPSMLDDLGLAAAVEWYAETRLQACGVEVSMETSGPEERLAPEIETTLFRVLQEAISNVARHARAERAVVRFEVGEHQVVAEVEDDGRGFDPEALTGQADRMSGLGVLGMRERIGLLGGQLTVNSRPGHGTLLRFEVPIDRSESGQDDDSSAAGRRPRHPAGWTEGAAGPRR